jgi:hypothetical protein
MNETKSNFKSLLKNNGHMTKNYTLLVLSYESIDDGVADNLAVELINKKLESKHGLFGKSYYTVEQVQLLSDEEANSIMQS